MNQYVTGAMIKRLREARGLTQQQLAERLNVGDKAISRWETGRGYPDIISFIAAVRDDGFELVRLYPEGPAQARFRIARTRRILYYCNRHGLFGAPVSPARDRSSTRQ